MGHSSVPDWPRTDPGVDATGRSYAVLAFGAEGAPVAEGWEREITARGLPLWSGRADPGDERAAGLVAELATAVVGWRLMVAGPQADVLAVHALAAAHGALDAEITAVVTGTGQRRVWCAHCGACTRGAGDVVGCGGCGLALRVEAHVSRRLGAWLGVRTDAEPAG